MKKKIKELAPLSQREVRDLVVKDQKAFQELVEKSMPEFVAKVNNKEDMANAIYSAGQEMLLVFEDILIRDFGFDNEKLKKLHNSTKDVLAGIKEYERHGLSILSPQDVAIVSDQIAEKGIAGLLTEIAGVRFQKEKLNRVGMEYPTTLGAAPFLKELKKRNKQK